MLAAIQHLPHIGSAVVSFRALLIPLGGMLHITLGGVTIYLNAETEEAWMELAPGYDHNIMLQLTNALGPMGYEIMDEIGSIEEFADGTIRNYVAQTWFPEEAEKEMSAAS